MTTQIQSSNVRVNELSPEKMRDLYYETLELRRSGIKISTISRILNVNYSTLHNWISGKRQPRVVWSEEKHLKFIKKMTLLPKGVLHPNWKGDNVTQKTGRNRAQKIFKSQPCENCGNPKTHRHHKDENTLNNTKENIQFLCAKHHTETHPQNVSRSNQMINSSPPGTAGVSGSLGVSPSGDSGRVFDNPFEPPPLDKEAPA